MFASGFVTLFFVALVGVNVVGYPVPEPIRRALAEHRTVPFEPIQAYINRDYVDRGIVKRQFGEEAVEAPHGVTQPYAKRQFGEEAVKAPHGVTQPYAKRQFGEEAVKAPHGVTQPYAKRQVPEGILL